MFGWMAAGTSILNVVSFPSYNGNAFVNHYFIHYYDIRWISQNPIFHVPALFCDRGRDKKAEVR